MPDISLLSHAAARPRTTPRLWALWCAVVAVLLGSALATADTGAAHPRQRGPVGSWQVTVTIGTGDDAMVATPRFDFAADHTLTTHDPAGTGYWNARPNGTFAFWITHPDDLDAAQPGEVQAVHLGTIRGNRLSSEAVAFLLDPAGAPLAGPIQVRAEGRRLSPGR